MMQALHLEVEVLEALHVVLSALSGHHCADLQDPRQVKDAAEGRLMLSFTMILADDCNCDANDLDGKGGAMEMVSAPAA